MTGSLSLFHHKHGVHKGSKTLPTLVLFLKTSPPHSLRHRLPRSLSPSTCRSTKLAELLGCPPSSAADMKVCLQQADPQDLLDNEYNTLSVPEIVPIPFAPYVDGHFLPDTVEVRVCVCVCAHLTHVVLSNCILISAKHLNSAQWVIIGVFPDRK